MNLSVCPGRDKLAGYLLGTIPEEEAETIAAHVAGCDTCEATLTEM